VAISLQQFVDNLVQSGLMTADEVSAFRETLPPNKQAADAQGLAYAHAEAVIHRDIKPGNLLLEKELVYVVLCDDGRQLTLTPGEFAKQCTGGPCTGPGSFPPERSRSAATALALLPFLAAGHSLASDGPYRKTVSGGISWLKKNQRKWGDPSGGERPQEAHMYVYGMATIVLCEAYRLSQGEVGSEPPRQAAAFIESAQHPKTGGWRRRTHGWESSSRTSARSGRRWSQTLTCSGSGTSKSIWGGCPTSGSIPRRSWPIVPTKSIPTRAPASSSAGLYEQEGERS